MVCMRSDGFLGEYIFSQEDKRTFSTGVLAYPSDSNLAKHLSDLKALKDSRWGAVGPIAFTKAVKDLNLETFSESSNLYYPIGLYELDLLLNPAKADEAKSRLKESQTVHLWNGHLVKSCVPKNINPPHGSAIRNLMEKHGVINSKFQTLDESWVRAWSANYFMFRNVYKLSSHLGPFKPYFKRLTIK